MSDSKGMVIILTGASRGQYAPFSRALFARCDSTTSNTPLYPIQLFKTDEQETLRQEIGVVILR
jgi:hypothetical protein